MTSDVDNKIETYLSRLRAELRGLNPDDIRDIVEELRSHILEKAGTGKANVETTLAALGPPEELAREYVTDNLLAQAEVTRSPWKIVVSLFRWASLSMAGFFVLMGSLAGYLIGGSFMWCAVLKLIHPQTAGLWVYGSPGFTLSLRMGFEGPPPGGRELLGWWIVPIGLLAGCGLVILTTRFSVWCVRRYRRARPLPGA